MAGLLDYLEAIGETGAMLGTGAVSGMVGMPYGVYKGVRSGKYGTQEGVRIAEEEARKFIERNTYQPRSQMAQNAIGYAGGLLSDARIPPVIPEAAALSAIPLRPAARMAGEGAMATGRFVAPKVGQLAEEYMQGMGMMPGILPQPGRSGIGAFDQRYDPRVNEQARMQAMTRNIELNQNASNAPTVSLADFEGRPFITSMADRTAAGGNLVGINDVAFNRPVGLLGGQDYMFNNPGQVWASAQGPVKQLMKQADEIKTATGQNPLYLPWRMAPTGGDFASMTGETMLAYADASMGKMQKKRLDKVIKGYIPDWSGVSDPASVAQFRAAPDKKRKAIKDAMDKNFRDLGGLNIGSARLAISDPAQFAAQEGGVQNVGEIFAKNPVVMQSGHPSYPRGVPGQGLGILAEDINIFELLPEVVRARGIANPTAPGQTDLRALQMKPYAGVITDDLLKRLGY